MYFTAKREVYLVDSIKMFIIPPCYARICSISYRLVRREQFYRKMNRMGEIIENTSRKELRFYDNISNINGRKKRSIGCFSVTKIEMGNCSKKHLEYCSSAFIQNEKFPSTSLFARKLYVSIIIIIVVIVIFFFFS